MGQGGHHAFGHFTAPDDRIDEIHRTRVVADQDLTRAGGGDRRLLLAQYVRPADFRNDDTMRGGLGHGELRFALLQGS